MRRTLPLLVLLALAGCSGAAPSPDDGEPSPPPTANVIGGAEERVMLACRADAPDDCVRAGVVTDGVTVERIRTSDGWAMAVESACVGDRCTAIDETGTEWSLEP